MQYVNHRIEAGNLITYKQSICRENWSEKISGYLRKKLRSIQLQVVVVQRTDD